MKLLITLFLSLPFLSGVLYANSPFLLTKLQSVYPLVEINTKKIPKKYIAPLLIKVKETTKELGIKSEGFSPRPLAIMISHVSVSNALVLKVELMLAEEVKRLDDADEVFALTYQKTDIFEVEDISLLEEDLFESVEFLLELFKEQYIEDNE